MNNIKPLSEIIKLKRKQKGYSLRELSNKCGLSHTYINQLEKNEVKDPSFETILKLSKVLNFDATPYINNPDILNLIDEDVTNKKFNKIVDWLNDYNFEVETKNDNGYEKVEICNDKGTVVVTLKSDLINAYDGIIDKIKPTAKYIIENELKKLQDNPH